MKEKILKQFGRESRSIVLLIFISFALFLFLAYLPFIFGFDEKSFVFGEELIDYLPSLKAIFLFVLGMTSIIIGYLLASWLIKRTSIFKFINLKRRKSKKQTTFEIFIWALFFLAVLSNVLSLVLVKGIPLFDISLRWNLDPRLVIISILQIILFPTILTIYFYKDKEQKHILIPLFLFSLILISILGARNLTFRFLLTLVLTLFFLSKEIFKKLSLIILILIIVSFSFIGFLSKNDIYEGGKEEFGSEKIAELAYTGSLGSFYYLDKLSEKIDTFGFFKGSLFIDSVLSLVPGTENEYANYQIGGLITGQREHVRNVGGREITSPLSISTTIVGIPYAEFGIMGIVLTLLLAGFLLAIFHLMIYFDLRALPLFAFNFSNLLYGIYAGIYGPLTIIGFFLTMIIFLVLLIRNVKENNNFSHKQSLSE